jgi:hypothetical protein
VDYDALLTQCFATQGYSPDQLLNNLVLPSFEDAESVAEDLKQYYMQLIRVSQKRYEEVKGILETFYRQLIQEKREEIDSRHGEMAAIMSKEEWEMEEQSTFAKIAEHHGEKLGQLRENFELFNTLIDTKFDEIMQKLRQWSGYSDGLDAETSFRMSEQAESLMTPQQSEDIRNKRHRGIPLDTLQRKRADSKEPPVYYHAQAPVM